MGSITNRNGRLYLDFRYQNQRCREKTNLMDTPANRQKLEKALNKIEAEILLDQLDYAKYFPNSKKARTFSKRARLLENQKSGTPLFTDFAETWLREKRVEWRQSYFDTSVINLHTHLIPYFGDKAVGMIEKADILEFRRQLSMKPGRKQNTTLSASRINHVMTPLRMILTEASDRFEFTNPWRNIKPLKEPRVEIHPFSIEEVSLILDTVRKDFRAYFEVRFFTGMRTSEIHGLKWKYVDFKRRQILIREANVQRRQVDTKTDASFRAIDMSQPVFDALKIQEKASRHLGEYVFCNTQGAPIDNSHFTKRVWYPLLRLLDLEKRRPYQTRHTTATLWLASGENPEWIARQMGHSTTEMLFRVYSRYVPNLTRQDGSAFEATLQRSFSEPPSPSS
ncbi:DUF3596 domain-containing protein [Sneathiella sp. P13V-1]|uniref:Arm DNA-binding domain-containing protein n=1 Tax=Sneathiella sp. P13V-1 TaxID=2697366 RepID=UPI00187B4408|nr:DUF3596 domain-containing protein [Sneathiella sp. P13V-1]MBE7635952.1 DUF3596 domain-containing protein [Sneathiella sp. P13V-1]